MPKSQGFVKLNRCNELLDLLEKDHQAFVMLTWIAVRANRETGEAMIGDWRRMGATSEAAYRRTKNRIQKAGLATFKATSKGTIASLANKHIFDINLRKADDQAGDQADDQPPKTPTTKPATNKNSKNFFIQELQEYGVRRELIEDWLKLRTAKRNTSRALKLQAKNFETLVDRGFSPTRIMDVLLENNWIGIKPNEIYFKKALRGKDDDGRSITDTSWATDSDQHALRDIQPGVREDVDDSQDGGGSSAGQKVVVLAS